MWEIAGVDNSWKLPRFIAKMVYAAGNVAGQGPLNVLLVGKKIAAGNMVVDSEVRQVFTREESITAGGEGSEISLMAIAAMKAQPLARIFIACPTEAGTASTITMTLSGTWSVAGTITVTINGVAISTTMLATDTFDTLAAAMVLKINASPDNPFVASYATPVLTLMSKNTGTTTKEWIVYQDLSLASAGFASAMVGSAIVNTFGAVKGVRAGAAGGATTESVATILTKMASKRWARIAFAVNDSTNAPLIKAFLTAQEAPTVQLYDQAILAYTSTQGGATTLSSSNLNAPRAQVFAYRNSETPPALIAAGWAAVRSATEGDDPIPDYDNYDCSAWIAPQRFDTDAWLPSESNALLNAGATPISTTNGVAYCQRGITSYCLNGSAQDERCIDVGDVSMADYVVLDIQNLYSTVFRVANKYVGPDAAAGQPEPPSGVGTPSMWRAAVVKRFNGYFVNGWLEDTFSGAAPSLPIAASYNSSAKRIQSNLPFVARRVQHVLTATVRQTSPS